MRFPVSLLTVLLEDIYQIDSVTLDPALGGGPCRRWRLYCVLTLRRHVVLKRPLRELCEVMSAALKSDISAVDMLDDTRCPHKLSASAQCYLADYKKLFGRQQSFYDLSQNPRVRPRTSHDNDPLVTLTANTSLVWRTSANRLLSLSELAVAQGLPSFAALACAASLPVSDFTGTKRTTGGR